MLKKYAEKFMIVLFRMKLQIIIMIQILYFANIKMNVPFGQGVISSIKKQNLVNPVSIKNIAEIQTANFIIIQTRNIIF